MRFASAALCLCLGGFGCGDDDVPDAAQDANVSAMDRSIDAPLVSEDAEPDMALQDAQPDVRPDLAIEPPTGTATFVCVGNFGYRQSTTDGENWQTIQNPDTGNDHSPDLLRDVHFANGVFMAVGGDKNAMVMRSTDGNTWEEDLYPEGTQWKGGVTYGNGRWVAVGGVGTNIYSDDNGATWTSNVNRLPFAGRDIMFANGRFVAVGDQGMIMSSSDGLTWTSHIQQHGLGHNSVAFGHGRFVVVANEWNGSGFDTACVTSTDGETFAACPFTAERFGSVAMVDGKLLISKETEGYVYTTDGNTWTEVEGRFPALVRFANTTFVGSGGGTRYFGSDIDALATLQQERSCRDLELGFVTP